MIENALARGSTLSSVMMGDALRKQMSTRESVVLLLVLAEVVRAVAGHEHSRPLTPLCLRVDLEACADMVMQRAVSWLEALLDAHYAALATEMTANRPLRMALTRILELLVDVDAASEAMDHAVGSWMHVLRMSSKRNQSLSGGARSAAAVAASAVVYDYVPTTLYQIDELRL